MVCCALFACCAAPGIASARPSYVGLGDSYSSGVGTRDYSYDSSSCQRSPYAYAPLIGAAKGYSLTFAACGGATTSDVKSSQVNSLSSTTNLVTITIGGNDAGFSSVMTNCAAYYFTCQSAINTANSFIANQLPGLLDSTYDAIRSHAPNADVVVLGYPRLFTSSGTLCNATVLTSSHEQELNQTADSLDSVISSRAAAHGFTYVDPRNAFSSHEVCSSSEWLNGLSNPLSESYHPNQAGQAEFATLIEAGLTHPPAASTGSASAIGASGATLSGSVNPNGQATTYHFDYGTSMSYGSQAPAAPDPSAGSGTASQSVSATLSNLQPSTPYHFRLEATNASGTTLGPDQTFTTGPPPVLVGAPSGPTMAPQGNWVGSYGATGYALAWSGLLVSVPSYVSFGNGHAAGLITWQSGTSDPRALQSPDQTTRIAAAVYDPNQIMFSATFNSAYNGNLEFYVLDWDSQGRRETISVNGVQANLNSDFSQGAWVRFPVNVPAGGTVTCMITPTAGPSAVLSGFFLN